MVDAQLARCSRYSFLVPIVKISKKVIMLFYQYFYLINLFIIINNKTNNINITQEYFIEASFNISQRYSLSKRLVDIMKL